MMPVVMILILTVGPFQSHQGRDHSSNESPTYICTYPHKAPVGMISKMKLFIDFNTEVSH